MTIGNLQIYSQGVLFYAGAVGYQNKPFDIGVPRVGKVANLPYLPKKSPIACDLPLKDTRLVVRFTDSMKAQTNNKKSYKVRLFIAVDTDLC